MEFILKKMNRKTMWYVGNGGISLRRVVFFEMDLKRLSLMNTWNTLQKIYSLRCMGCRDLKYCHPKMLHYPFLLKWIYDRCIELDRREDPFGLPCIGRYDFYSWKPLIEALDMNWQDLGDEAVKRWIILLK